MLNRIRADAVVKKRLKLTWPAKTEAACDNVIDQVRDFTGETISRGVAVRLIRGVETVISGEMFRSTAAGDLVRNHKRCDPLKILARFERLRGLVVGASALE